MKAILIGALALACCGAATARGGHSGGGHSSHSSSYGGAHHVAGHTTKNGTYVAPHRATNPNHTQRDNWSSKPNTNPDTGKSGTKEPQH